MDHHDFNPTKGNTHMIPMVCILQLDICLFYHTIWIANTLFVIDYYSVLGVDRKASAEQLKQARSKLGDFLHSSISFSFYMQNLSMLSCRIYSIQIPS